ncbi:MAG TPA: helix-turn-helix domain-containing protein [Ensifer sp.]|jgi:DNA-binding transcriptional regulator YiaG|uniref:helix-turn-helix domain-containing protein n=1 Tax=Ensifer sp. TaxID=1872086 RepID=UPI002E0FAA6E|nr:helix-turn-helix domain-containing protein [Ensifer sp.]
MNRENFYCGDDDLAQRPYHYMECGLDNIYLMNGYTIEEEDGEEYVSIDSVDELWKAIGLNLVTNKKILSPQEIKYLRDKMDKTQAEVASLLRVDDQTVARWEKGKTNLSGTADVAYRVLFLGSPVAQPEGSEILTRWIETIRKLIEKDTPTSDDVLFEQHNHSWERRMYA